MEIKSTICKAVKILEGDTPYKKNKELIRDLIRNDQFSEVNLYKQLTVIDSMYSTNMSKRFFGIEEIAEAILELFTSQEDLESELKLFLLNPYEDSRIKFLFEKKFGYSKTGKKKAAVSLLSKYFYFVSDLNFPIYDTLVQKFQRKLIEFYKLGAPKVRYNSSVIEYFDLMVRTKKSIGDDISYDGLDTFVWLIGKLKDSSFSLIINLIQFRKLIEIANGVDIEVFMKDAIYGDCKDKVEAIIGKNLIEMYEFAIENFD